MEYLKHPEHAENSTDILLVRIALWGHLYEYCTTDLTRSDGEPAAGSLHCPLIRHVQPRTDQHVHLMTFWTADVRAQ